MTEKRLQTHAVILAGGRGTRFWPRSRTRTPKQLLNIVGKTTMLEQTVARLRPLIPAKNIWTVTNAEQAAAVRKQMPAAARKRVLTEPIGRNTAAAIALAAIHIRHAAKGDALMAVLPADHYIAQPDRFRSIATAALDLAGDSGANGCAGHSSDAAGDWIWLHRADGRCDGLPKDSRFSRSGVSRKNRNLPSQKNISHPGLYSGMPACFSGAFPRSWTS